MLNRGQAQVSRPCVSLAAMPLAHLPPVGARETPVPLKTLAASKTCACLPPASSPFHPSEVGTPLPRGGRSPRSYSPSPRRLQHPPLCRVATCVSELAFPTTTTNGGRPRGERACRAELRGFSALWHGEAPAWLAVTSPFWSGGGIPGTADGGQPSLLGLVLAASRSTSRSVVSQQSSPKALRAALRPLHLDVPLSRTLWQLDGAGGCALVADWVGGPDADLYSSGSARRRDPQGERGSTSSRRALS